MLGILSISLFFVVIAGIIVLAFIFWIKMLIDCANRNFPNSNDKIVWILVIILLHFLGAIIYWAVIASSKQKT